MEVLEHTPEARVRTERRLVEAAVAGDGRSFERIVARWEGEVLNLAYRLTGDREEALDIRQATFIRVHAGLARFDGACRFSTWLYRIVVNLCRDHERRRRSAWRRLRIAREQAADPPAHTAGAVAPDGHVQRAELSAIVATAVAALPADQREVLVLRHYHQMPMPDVAGVLGVPVTTARSRLAAAMTRLRERLGDIAEGRTP